MVTRPLPSPPPRLGCLPDDLARAVAERLDAAEIDPTALAWAEKLRRFVELPGAGLVEVAVQRFGPEDGRRTLGAMALPLAKAAAAGRAASPEGLPDLAHLNAALRALEAAGSTHAGAAEGLVVDLIAAAKRAVRGRLPRATGWATAPPPAPVEAAAGAALPFRIVLIGRPGSSYTATALRLLRAAGLTVAGLVAVARPTRRSLVFRLRASLLGRWRSRDHAATPLLRVTRLADPAVAALLERVRPDAVVYAGGGIVPPAVLARAGRGVVNAHNALLPGYRGLDAPAWALLEGRLEDIGVTGHLMDASLDTGPILCRRPVAAARFTTLPALEAELWRLMAAMLAEATLALRGGATAEPQAAATRQYFRQHRHLRALVPEALATLR